MKALNRDALFFFSSIEKIESFYASRIWQNTKIRRLGGQQITNHICLKSLNMTFLVINFYLVKESK